MANKNHVLAIGDIHAPATWEHYLERCREVKKEWDCGTVVCLGDIIDHHCISHHARHPEYTSAQEEYKKAMSIVRQWHKAFPDMTITVGNHDDRVQRICGDAGVPKVYLRSFNELYGTASWNWVSEFMFDGVLYVHGHKGGGGGIAPALNQAKARMCSVVMGHYHSVAGINWAVGPTHKVFGMNVGCGIDHDSLAFAYDSGTTKMPVLSCGVVLNGNQPHLIMME